MSESNMTKVRYYKSIMMSKECILRRNFFTENSKTPFLILVETKISAFWSHSVEIGEIYSHHCFTKNSVKSTHFVLNYTVCYIFSRNIFQVSSETPEFSIFSHSVIHSLFTFSFGRNSKSFKWLLFLPKTFVKRKLWKCYFVKEAIDGGLQNPNFIKFENSFLSNLESNAKETFYKCCKEKRFRN